jgi:site-specific DNA-methyltransferase (adenine-specific)/modification methylase
MRKEIIGDATLYLGDCREILPTLERVDAVITDPPYGVGLSGKKNKWRSQLTGGYESFEDSPENVILEIVPRLVAALVLSSGRGVVTPGTRMIFDYPRPDAIGGIYNRCGAGSGKWGFECVAPVLYYGKDPYLSNGLGRRPNGFEQPVNDYAGEWGHPCSKPIGLMNWLVDRGSLPEETILDPVMGSGTTGVACFQRGRSFIGIEREPKYFEIACRRIEDAQRQESLFEPAPKAEQMGLVL